MGRREGWGGARGTEVPFKFPVVPQEILRLSAEGARHGGRRWDGRVPEGLGPPSGWVGRLRIGGSSRGQCVKKKKKP